METVTSLVALIIAGITAAVLFKRQESSTKERAIQDLETKQAIKHAEVQQKQENYKDAKKVFQDKYNSLTNKSDNSKPRT